MPTADTGQSLRLNKLGLSLMQRVLGPLAVRNIDLDANPSEGSPSLIVQDDRARLDPPHLAVAHYSKFQGDLGFAIGQRATSDIVERAQIVRIHQRAPILA